MSSEEKDYHQIVIRYLRAVCFLVITELENSPPQHPSRYLHVQKLTIKTPERRLALVFLLLTFSR